MQNAPGNVLLMPIADAEQERLALALSRTENRQRWGTYLPDRPWGRFARTTPRTATPGLPDL